MKSKQKIKIMTKIKRQIDKEEIEELNKLPLSGIQKTHIIDVWSQSKKPTDIKKSTELILMIILGYTLFGLVLTQLIKPETNLTKFIGWWGWIVTIFLMIIAILSPVGNIIEQTLLSLSSLQTYFQIKTIWRKSRSIIDWITISVTTLGLVHLDRPVLASLYILSILLIRLSSISKRKKIDEKLKKINEDHYGENTIPI